MKTINEDYIASKDELNDSTFYRKNKISTNFFLKNKDKINIYFFSKYQNISDTFFEKYIIQNSGSMENIYFSNFILKNFHSLDHKYIIFNLRKIILNNVCYLFLLRQIKKTAINVELNKKIINECVFQKKIANVIHDKFDNIINGICLNQSLPIDFIGCNLDKLNMSSLKLNNKINKFSLEKLELLK